MIARLNSLHELEHRLQTPRRRRRAGVEPLVAARRAVPREALMATLLAFDTSTERMAVALLHGERILGHEAAGGAQASAALSPAIRALLESAGVDARALDAIAFGRGPGAFTGLRTACAVAQGYAFGLGKPVLALDTLMAVAEDARQRHGAVDVWVAMDARMDEIYAAHYRHAAARWQVQAEPALYEVDFSPEGFEWVEADDAQRSVFAFLRKARDGAPVLVLCNLTPLPRTNYTVGVPLACVTST